MRSAAVPFRNRDGRILFRCRKRTLPLQILLRGLTHPFLRTHNNAQMKARHLRTRRARQRRICLTTGLVVTAWAASLCLGRLSYGAEAPSTPPSGQVNAGSGVREDASKKIDRLGQEAWELRKKGDLPGALKKISEAIDSIPAGDLPHGLREGTYTLRATVLMDLKRFKEALKDWTVLIEGIQPGDPHAYTFYKARGVCRLALGDPVFAQRDASEAKRLAPKTIAPKEREDLELFLRMTGDGIAQAAKSAIDLDGPGGEDLFKKQTELTAEAAALLGKDDLRGALEKANQAVDLWFPSSAPRFVRANILMNLDRYKEAIEDWDYLSEPDVMIADALPIADFETLAWRFRYERGTCRLKLGDRKGAQEDALEAKRLAPKTIDAEDLENIEVLRIRSGPAFPLGGNWARVTTDNGHQVGAVWELHTDGKCVIHFQTLRPGGQYSGSGPSNRAWPGDERTRFGEATFRDGRWRMTFAEPKGSTATGTYELSPDSEALLGTQDGVEGRFTRKLVTVNPDSGSEPNPSTSNSSPSPTPPQPMVKVPAASKEALLNYFDWGKELCSLGRYSFQQKTAEEKEVALGRQAALTEKLPLGNEIVSNFNALAKISRGQSLPSGNYSGWAKNDQQRWDKEIMPAALALSDASNRLIAKTPEQEFFYLLGFETTVLAVALPGNVSVRGLRNAVTRSELSKGVGAFVWLRARMPPNCLSPEVAASVNSLASYKTKVSSSGGEPMAQAEVEKIIALATAISDARDGGNLLR